jgi:hypothetical protein
MSEGLKIHIHFVSRDATASGHIDAIVPGALTLRLPRGGSGWSARYQSPGACSGHDER